MTVNEMIPQLLKLVSEGNGDEKVYTNDSDEGYVEVEDIEHLDIKWRGGIKGVVIS